MRKVFVIGADGQLGTDLMIELEKRDDLTAVPSTIADLDITDHSAVRERLAKEAAAIVINTAAYHRVDELEENIGKALQVNVEAVHNLACVCRVVDSTLVHFSTDYVFGGPPANKPRVETDLPFPESVYAISKLAGETVVAPYCRKHFVIRTCGLYGHAGSLGKGGNFVETMLRLAAEGNPLHVVNDQRCTPTFTRHLAKKILELVVGEGYGLYHMTGTGDCTWYEFAKAIFEYSKLDVSLSPCTTAERPAPAKRPFYSVLDNKALRDAGFEDMPHWRDALREYLQDRKKITTT